MIIGCWVLRLADWLSLSSILLLQQDKIGAAMLCIIQGIVCSGNCLGLQNSLSNKIGWKLFPREIVSLYYSRRWEWLSILAVECKSAKAVLNPEKINKPFSDTSTNNWALGRWHQHRTIEPLVITPRQPWHYGNIMLATLTNWGINPATLFNVHANMKTICRY